MMKIAIADSNKETRKSSSLLRIKWRKWFIYIVFIALIFIFSFLNENFATLDNFMIIGKQAAIVGLLTFGMTFVITAAEIDLSVGSIVALVGMVSALCLEAGQSILVSSLAGIGTGVAIGFVNGLIVAKLKIPSFLVTLGTLGIASGIALTLTNTQAVTLYNQDFGMLWGNGYLFGIPTMILWLVAFLIITIIIYNFTPFGNYVRAVGGNRTAARYSGVKIDKVIMTVFLISGFLSAIGGMMMLARLNSGRPEVGSDLNMDAVTAVILGGTSLFGGKGSILNSFIGALIITVITNALVILGIESSIQSIIKGAIVIAAVSLSEKG